MGDIDLDNGAENFTNNYPGRVLCPNETLLNCSALLERDEELAKIEMGTLFVMFFMTVSGNGTVLAALFARRQLASQIKFPKINFFMLHLCVADMCTAWLNILPQLAWEITFRFKGGQALCKFVKFGQTLGPYLSSYVLTVTALDRFHAICNPLTYCSWSCRRARGMIMGAWALSILFCIPQLTIFSYQEVAPGVFDCWAVFSEPFGERVYVTWYAVSVFAIPLVSLIYTYTCICKTIWYNKGPLSASAPHKVVSRAKINTIKQTVAVIVLYIACSLPFICAQLWAAWGASSRFLSGGTFTILTLLSSLNSCVNPWIYLTSNHDLMEALWVTLFCRKNKERTDNLGSGGSSGRQNQNCTLPGRHSHLAKWVASYPPNLTESEKTTLRLFRTPNRNVWSSVEAKCEINEPKTNPEL